MRWGCTLACVLALSGSLCADTLVCKDGRRIEGQVRQEEGAYIVTARYGTIRLSESDVDQWIRGGEAAPTTGPATRPVSSKALEARLKQAQDALEAGKFTDARDGFLDAIALNRYSATAWHGLGLAYLGAGDKVKALQMMEKAASVTAPNRALVINLCSLYTSNGDCGKAIRLAKDYLAPRSSSKEFDEEVLNAYAIAMAQADPQVVGATLYQQADQFYGRYQFRMESARPGQRRWGLQWMPEKEVKAKFERLRDMEKSAIALRDKLVTLEQSLKKARTSSADFPASSYDVQRLELEYSTTAERFQEACRLVPRPVYPRTLNTVALDALTPPQIGAVQVAYDPPAEKAPGTGVANAGNSGSSPWGSGPVAGRTGGSDPAHAPVGGPVASAGTNAMPGGVGGASGGTESPAPGRPAPTNPAPGNPAPASPASAAQLSIVPEAPRPTVVVRPSDKKDQRIVRYAAAFAVGPDLLVTAASAVQNATEIELQGTDGFAMKASLVKSDPQTGLALLRATGKRMQYLPLADTFAGGAVSCPAFCEVSIFEPSTTNLAGQLASASGNWGVSFPSHPRLAGAPLISGGKVVGVELARRDSEGTRYPVATLEQIRALCGETIKPGALRDPAAAVFQVMATSENR